MSGPRRPTIHDVAAPFENYLINVPASAADVCATCHSAALDAWPRCYPCNEIARRLPWTADAVASVSLAPSNEQLARDLYAYKDERIDAARRQRLIWGLGAVTYKWLHVHESCLARSAGATAGFDLITSVPSSSGRAGEHPLVTALTAVVTGSGARYRDLLQTARVDLGPRDIAADRYRTTQPVRGDILLVDDSWVSGAKPQAAAAALKEGGAASVAILTIGRWFQPDYAPAEAWLRDKRRPDWDWTTCCVH